jgi:hypothetical protein
MNELWGHIIFLFEETMQLNITKYYVPAQKWELKTVEEGGTGKRELVDYNQDMNPADEIHAILRINGIFPSLTEAVDAILLAKKIKDSKDSGTVEINEHELSLIKKSFDVLLKRTTENPNLQFGGIMYEELFIRVASLGK